MRKRPCAASAAEKYAQPAHKDNLMKIQETKSETVTPCRCIHSKTTANNHKNPQNITIIIDTPHTPP